MIVKRGDVFFADLSPVVGSEQGGVRPVLIIQNDIGNRFSPTVIVAAITAQIQRAKLPTHVELESARTGLDRDCVVLLEQIRTVDKARLSDKITHIDDELMQLVNEAYLLSGGIIEFGANAKKDVENFFMFVLDNRINEVEDYEHEFKEIHGNPVNSIKDTVSEYVASFLNSRGGRIIYGVTNERIVKGVRVTASIMDEINKNVYCKLAAISPAISPDHFEIIYHPVYDKDRVIIDELYIIEVITPISLDKSAIYFVKGNELYVRVKGIKKKLLGNEIVSYIQKRLLNEQ